MDPQKLVVLLDSLTPQERHFYGFPPKRRGRPKGKQQSETLGRIRDAAALILLQYSQARMVPLLYPKQHVPEAGRKAVNKFLSRFKDAIVFAGKTMTQTQAERIVKCLPRGKK